MKRVTLWRKESEKIKKEEFVVKDIIYKENYVIFITKDWIEQVIKNFENFFTKNL